MLTPLRVRVLSVRANRLMATLRKSFPENRYLQFERIQMVYLPAAGTYMRVARPAR